MSQPTAALLDITPSMAVYMDPHVLVKTLEFLGDNNIQDPQKMNKSILTIMKRTNRNPDMIMAMYEKVVSLPGGAELFAEDRLEFLQARSSSGASASATVTSLLQEIDPEITRALAEITEEFSTPEKEKNPLERLKSDFLEEHNISKGLIDACIVHSKKLYDLGEYAAALVVIKTILRVQFTSTASLLRVLWGGLASAMMSDNWEEAMKLKDMVKETIENKQQPRPSPDTFEYIPQIDQLRNRATFLHWALFIFPNSDPVNGMELFVSLCMDRVYLQCIENLCPWMLRYLAAGLILSPIKRQHCLKEALNVITSLSYRYSDPLTKFLENLFRDFDFDLAQEQLLSFREVIQKDFFLQRFQDKFTHESRVLICEMYCRIHCKIDLKQLAIKMQLSDEEVELWMVNLVRGGEGARGDGEGGSSLDAKIDSANGLVIMAPPTKSNYNRIVERTREVSARSDVLASNVRNALEEQARFIKYRRQLEPPRK